MQWILPRHRQQVRRGMVQPTKATELEQIPEASLACSKRSTS